MWKTIIAMVILGRGLMMRRENRRITLARHQTVRNRADSSGVRSAVVRQRDSNQWIFGDASGLPWTGGCVSETTAM
jgi:hypothetical protein